MIKFGTDGWRGIIAEDFTFDNLRLVGIAAAKYLKKITDGKRNTSCVVGYDGRFLSKEFAHELARVLAWQGVIVNLTDKIASTPQVSYHTKQKTAELGFVITASHNPAEYNGFKVKASFGGPATPNQIKELEKILNKIEAKPPKIRLKDFNYYVDENLIRIFDPQKSYFRHLKKKLDFDAIEKANFKILYDPMHGAGINTLDSLLKNVTEIHSEWNPGFGNLDHPEPIEECLEDLIKEVKNGKYDFAFATDGDADRIGAVDGKGNFVNSHQIFMIILKYLYEFKKKRGSVVKTVSLTSMVDMYCEDKKIKLHTTPVGFKYTADIMSQERVLVGGEESGGLGTFIHLPERDGIFIALLLLEVMAKRKMSLTQLCGELDDEFGPHKYERRDVRMTESEKNKIIKSCKKLPNKVGRFVVDRIDTKDGFKFYFDNSWLLVRPSGTEPLLRFYAEAETSPLVNELLDEAMKL